MLHEASDINTLLSNRDDDYGMKNGSTRVMPFVIPHLIHFECIDKVEGQVSLRKEFHNS